MSLSASDVSDAVLEGLQKLTGFSGVRDALAELERWQNYHNDVALPLTADRPQRLLNFMPLTTDRLRRLLAFAISVAETEVARLDDEEENNANQQHEEDLKAEGAAHVFRLDQDDMLQRGQQWVDQMQDEEDYW